MPTLADLKAQHHGRCFDCGLYADADGLHYGPTARDLIYACVPNPIIAALIAKALEDEATIVALRAQLEEADRALLFWRGYPEYIFSSDMEDGEPKQAVKNALAREAERQKGRVPDAD